MALWVNGFRRADPQSAEGLGLCSLMVCTVVGSAAEVARVRGEFTHWLQRHFCLDESRRSDLALAVNEALINAVEFGHPARARDGVITVNAIYDKASGTLTVKVRDRGRWRLRLADTDTAAKQSVKRGYGIALMRLLADELRINPSQRGTQVTLVWTDVQPRYLVSSRF